MRFLVLGAGGIGGYFGGRLVENGADVTFLVRERRREQLERDGLRIESVYGNTTLRVSSILAGDLQPRYDVVLLTCKAYDLESSIDAIAPGLAPGGCVVPFLNGIAHLDALNARFGRERVLGGTAQIGITLTRDGLVKHLNDWRTIIVGEQDGGVSARASAIAAAFPAASVIAQASGDILQEMWEKLVHLATAASMTCLMRANVGEIARTESGAALLTRTFELMAAIATHHGHAPRAAFLEKYRRVFSDRQSGYATSMLRDVEAGHRTEGSHIVGFALEKGRAAGLDVTILEIAYTHLQAYDNRRAAGRLPGQN
jgi:2-dehydropantoate 2-reductase